MADDETEVTPRAGELSTANYGWIKPNVGDSDDAWGGMLNTDLDGIDATVKSVSNAIPAASSTTPVMDGTAAVGVGTTWARADHKHPSDTTKYDASNPSGYQTAANVTAAVPVASSTTPLVDGTAAVGTGTTWARADHVHPSDTAKLSLSGGTMTGALIPSQTAGLVGTTTNNNAVAGSVGEYQTVSNTTGTALTNSTATTVASFSLTAGDWDVWASGMFVPGATTTVASFGLGMSATAATFPPQNCGTNLIAGNFTTGSVQQITCGPMRFLLSATTTIYLVAISAFGVSTMTAQGAIFARRAR